MKKMLPVIFALAIATLLIACYLVKCGLNNNIGCSEALKPKESLGLELAHIPNSGEKADKFYVEQIVGNYERLLIHAINDNDFSLIKNLFIPDSNTYKSQKQFVAEQYSMDIKHKFSRIYLEGIEQVENEISGSEAVNLCYEVLGEKAVETGFALSYQHVDSVEIENKKYYVINMYWLVEDSHWSFIGNAMVSNNGHEIFDGALEQNGSYIIAEKIWSR